MSIENAYRLLFLGALIWFSLLVLIMLFRAVIGPGISDRILSINMIGTMVISGVCILSFVLNETYLLDIALLYAMISFAAVLILCATYIPKNPSRTKFLLSEGDDEDEHTPAKDGAGQERKSVAAMSDDDRNNGVSENPAGRKGGERI